MFKITVQSNDNYSKVYQPFGHIVGFIDRDTLDESLSETQIEVYSTSSKDLTPFSDILITIIDQVTGRAETVYRTVVLDEVSQCTFTSIITYKHVLTVDELAKKTERVNVDNLSFTNEYEVDASDSPNINTSDIVVNTTSSDSVSNITPSSGTYRSLAETFMNAVVKASLVGSSVEYYGGVSTVRTYINIDDSGHIYYTYSYAALYNQDYATNSIPRVLVSRLLNQYRLSSIGENINIYNDVYVRKDLNSGYSRETQDISFSLNSYSNIQDYFTIDYSGVRGINVASSIGVPQISFTSNTIELGINESDKGVIFRRNYTFQTSGNIITDYLSVLYGFKFNKFIIYLERNNGTAANPDWQYERLVYDSSTSSTYPNTIEVNSLGTYRYKIYVYINGSIKVSNFGGSDTTYEATTQLWTGIIYSQPIERVALVPDTRVTGISLKNVVDRVCRLSAQLSPFTITNVPVKSNKYDFVDDNNSFIKVDAPELIITNKNLWEALKLIGSYANAIPYVEPDNTIHFLDLSKQLNVPEAFANLQRINYASRYSSNDYTKALDVTVDNLISDFYDHGGTLQEPDNLTKAFISENVIIGPKADNTLVIDTKYPIYRLVSNYPVICRTPDGGQYGISSSYVKELSIYNAMSVNDQTRCIYFEQGKKGIHGLTYKVSQNYVSDATDNKITIKNILAAAGVPSVWLDDDTVIQLSFTVLYVPMLSARLKYFKDSNKGIELYQNASSNVLDSKQLGRTMKNALSRMGNPTYTEVYKVPTFIEGLEVGQRTSNGYIISTIDRDFHNNYILYTITYIKDFHALNEYLSVHNEQRYYEVSEKQSLDRYVNTNCFYTFSRTQKTVVFPYGVPPFISGGNAILLTTLNPGYLYGDGISWDTTCSYITTRDSSRNVIGKFLLPTLSIASGNTINYITDFEDNYSAGDQKLDVDNNYVVGTPSSGNSFYKIADKYYIAVNSDNNFYVPTFVRKSTNYVPSLLKQACPYGDQYGRLSTISVRGIHMNKPTIPYSNEYIAKSDALSRLLPALGYYSNYTTFHDLSSHLLSSQVPNASTVTRPTYYDTGCSQGIYVDKDSREVIHINQQHHFISDSPDIIVGRAMTEMSPFVSDRGYQHPRLVLLNRKLSQYDDRIESTDILQSIRCVASGNSNDAQADTGYFELHIDTDDVITSFNAGAKCESWAIVMWDNYDEISGTGGFWRLVVGVNESLGIGDSSSTIYLNKDYVTDY